MNKPFFLVQLLFNDMTVLLNNYCITRFQLMNVDINAVHELKPGNAIIIKKNGQVSIDEIRAAQERKACSFERIYFSRGSDKDIYEERKTR